MKMKKLSYEGRGEGIIVPPDIMSQNLSEED